MRIMDMNNRNWMGVLVFCRWFGISIKKAHTLAREYEWDGGDFEDVWKDFDEHILTIPQMKCLATDIKNEGTKRRVPTAEAVIHLCSTIEDLEQDAAKGFSIDMELLVSWLQIDKETIASILKQGFTDSKADFEDTKLVGLNVYYTEYLGRHFRRSTKHGVVRSRTGYAIEILAELAKYLLEDAMKCKKDMLVGTKVRMVNCLEAETRSEITWTTASQPWQLRNGTWLVLLDGYRGGFSLECLEVVE
jgi:hypothetical protein